MFQIGDKVWYASVEHQEKWVPCTDCLGHKYLRVTFGDGTEVSIDCALCALGFEPPRGVIKLYSYDALVREIIIGGMEIQKGKSIEYKFDCYSGGCYRADEDRVFATKEEADAAAKILATKMTQDEIDRINRKEKETRTWAWNASYHRRCIKDAKRDVEYHTAKLEVANKYAKQHTLKLSALQVLDDAHHYLQDEQPCDCGRTAETCIHRFV